MDGELDPIKRDQVSGFVMMGADLDVLPPGYQPMSADPATLANMKSALGGAKSSLNSMVTSMATIGLINENMGEDVTKVMAAVQLIGGGAQLMSAMRVLHDIQTVQKTSEGLAHIARYGPGAVVVGAVAIGAAIAYEFMIREQTRQYEFRGDYSNPAGIRSLQRQIESAGVKV